MAKEPHGRNRWAIGLTLGLAAVAGIAAPSPQAEPEPAQPSRGAVLYRLHCAPCHGTEGRADGPIAEHLTRRPPDLTRIAARREGRFSTSEVERLIDGRTLVEPHGRSEMPVWGLSLREPGRLTDQEEETWLQIRQLVRHLRSMQVGEVVDEP